MSKLDTKTKNKNRERGIRAVGRISLLPETRDLIRDFTQGTSGTYSEVIEWLLDKVMEDGEDPKVAGRRCRLEFSQYLKKKQLEELEQQKKTG